MLPHSLILAPIRGITDCHFRTIFAKHFPGFAGALAPFINPQHFSHCQIKQFKDLLPENNQELPVTPQLLHNKPEDFLFVSECLADLGYTEVNWNLGCPAPMVAKKRRGSGLLPYPDQILCFLDKIVPKLPVTLSIKTRLGLHAPQELLTLLPKLDSYPLSEIIIHGRLGSQLYKGEVDKESVAICVQQSKHSIVYNGDIKTKDDFTHLQSEFPSIIKWMIGRGALANPFLIEEIAGKQKTANLLRVQDFHDELYECYQTILSGQAHLLGRVKQLWVYLSAIFPEQQKVWKQIKKCTTTKRYTKTIHELFSITI